MNFIVVYYSLVAGIVWCIIFAYTWLLRSQTYDKIKNRKDKWSSYYHMVAWSIPLVLTVIIAALQQIDGDGLWGICIVGVQNKAMRLIFVLGPLLGLIIACAFLGFCIFKLIYLDRTSKEIMSKHAKKKIRESIWKLTVFLFSIAIFMLVTFYCQFYEWYHSTSWKDSFRKYLFCGLHVSGAEPENCSLPDRPNVSLVQLQLFTLFLFFISAAAWICTACSTVDTWQRFIFKNLLRQEMEENIKLKKYKVIARAFEKRKCLDSDELSNGVISIDVRRSHQDPVGLDFDLNSIGSNESTTWVKIIPQLMRRRAGIIPVSHSNRNSTDSEISYSYTEFQRSRRQSLDSTQETTSYRHIEFTAKPCGKRHRKNRRRTQSCSPEIKLKRPTRRFEEDLEIEVLQALKIGNFKVESSGAPNTKRRMAITEIDMDSLKFLAMGKKLMDNPAGNSSSSSGESGATNDESKSANSESANNSISCQETETV